LKQLQTKWREEFSSRRFNFYNPQLKKLAVPQAFDFKLRQ
jgi:hypothetical protein